ncbi:MAG TPA: hypothetical protein VGG02_02900 [Chthoniobacterales bacterium]
MPDPTSQPTGDAEALARALELELQSKRAGWQRARARRNLWRALSLLFLLLVIVGALFAWLSLQPRVRERAAKPAAASTR